MNTTFLRVVVLMILVASLIFKMSYIGRANLETEIPNNQYLAMYYDNATLKGEPLYIQIDEKIEYNWKNKGPARLEDDYFSIKWQGYFRFESTTYLFHHRSNDGIRVWVDGDLIIDYWDAHRADDIYLLVRINEGNHLVKCEYYEETGLSEVSLSWRKYEAIKSINKKIHNNHKFLPVLIEFSDEPHVNSEENIHQYLFSSQNDIHSLRNYFYNVSLGKLDITSGEYGVGNWIKLEKKRRDYKGKWSNSDNDAHVLLKDIADCLTEKDININEYDIDQDKIIDHLMIICSGPPSKYTIFWNHSGFNDKSITIQGYSVGSYSIVNEICHENNYNALKELYREFFHVLGGENLYSELNSEDVIGPWDIMGKHDFSNFGLSGFSRSSVGWLNPTKIQKNGRFDIYALGSDYDNQLYRIDIPCTTEYLLIENRQKISTDEWWKGITDDGIVIYHVDESIPIGYRFNDGSPAYPNYAICNKNPLKVKAYSEDNFLVRYTPYTTPSLRDNKAISPCEIFIHDISKSGIKMTFSVEFRIVNTFPVFEPQYFDYGSQTRDKKISGRIDIKNIGTGVLFCNVYTDQECLHVNTDKFLSNNTSVSFDFNLAELSIGAYKEYIFLETRDKRIFKFPIKFEIIPLYEDLNFNLAMNGYNILLKGK
jgi:M6 family metalloprotease-like protein